MAEETKLQESDDYEEESAQVEKQDLEDDHCKEESVQADKQDLDDDDN